MVAQEFFPGWRRLALLAVFCCWAGTTSRSQELAIGKYEIVAQRRVSQSEFEYYIRAELANRGERAVHVGAKLDPSTLPARGRVLDGTLSFPLVAPGGKVGSSDTFAVRLDRRTALAPELFRWTFEAIQSASAPRIAVTSPRHLANIDGDEVVVEGTTSLGASVEVNRVAAVVVGGTFQARIPLAAGLNVVTAVARNAVGNEESVSVTVRRLPPAASIVIESPEDGSQTDSTSVWVKGSVSAAAGVDLRVNGVEANVVGGKFQVEAALTFGVNQILAVAHDEYNRRVSAAITVVRPPPPEPPTIDILSPGDRSRVVAPLVEVTGTVTPGAQVRVNGVEATVVGDRFSAVVTVDLGRRSITAIATDAWGLSGSDTVSVDVAPDLPPEITLHKPGAGPPITEGTQIELKAEVSDDVGVVRVDFIVGGQLALSDSTPPYGGYFTLPLGAGDRSTRVEAIATDTAGQTSLKTVDIAVIDDFWAPTVYLVSPGYGAFVNLDMTDTMLVIDASHLTAAASGLDVDGDGAVDSVLKAEVLIAKELLRLLNPATARVGVARYRGVADLVQPLTSDFAAAGAALDGILAAGPALTSSILASDAVRVATDELLGVRARRGANAVQFFLSGAYFIADSGETLRASYEGVCVHSIPVGSGANTEHMHWISRTSGCRVTEVQTMEQLNVLRARAPLFNRNEFELYGTATDQVGVSRIDFRVWSEDGRYDLRGTDSTHPFSTVFSISDLTASKSFLMQATAYDTSENSRSTWPAPLTIAPAAENPPQILEFKLPLAYVGGTVSIHGRNFDPVFENNEVRIGGVRALIQGGNKTQLQVVVPEGGSNGDVVVTSGGKSSAPKPLWVLPTGEVQVQVSYMDGTPVSGAKIYLRDSFTMQTTASSEFRGSTDAAGRILLAGVRGDFTVSAPHPNDGMLWEAQNGTITREGERVSASLHFQGFTTARGTARFASGEPAANTRLILRMSGFHDRSIVTQADGVYRFDSVLVGRDFELLANHPSGETGRATLRANTPGEDLIRDMTMRAVMRVTDTWASEGDEGTRDMIFEVTLTSASLAQVRLDYYTEDSGARATQDYQARSGTLVFAPGESRKRIVIPILGDRFDEGDEKILLYVKNAVNASLEAASVDALLEIQYVTGIIVDDDPTPEFSVADVAVTEGNVGEVPLRFTAVLSAASARVVMVLYTTASGSALDGDDYVSAGQWITFYPGETQKQFTITVRSDTKPESDESFFVNFIGSVNVNLTDSQAMGTILDDDAVERQLQYFEWTPIESPQGMDEPFGIEVTAKDAFGNTVTSFDGSVSLQAGRYDRSTGLNLLAYWDFNQLEFGKVNDRVGGVPGTLYGGAESTEDRGGWTGLAGDRAIHFGNDGGAERFVGVDDSKFLGALGWAASKDRMSIVFRQKLKQVSSSMSFRMLVASGGGSEGDIQAQAPGSDNFIHFDTPRCCDPEERLSANIETFPEYSGSADWWTTWHHFAFVKDRGRKAIYIDGRLFAERSGVSPLQALIAFLTIGAGSGHGSNIRGWMDDFAVFGSALTADEVSQLAGGTAPDQLPERALTAATGPRNMLRGIGSSTTETVNGTVGLWFIPGRDIRFVAFRHYFGSKGYLWDDLGNVLAEQSLTSIPGKWLETPVKHPVLLRAGYRYRIGVEVINDKYSRRSIKVPWMDGVVVGGSFGAVGTPINRETLNNNVSPLVDFSYWTSDEIDYTPQVISGFVNGVYSGQLTVRRPESEVVLTVNDGQGHRGQSNPIEVVPRNDLSILCATTPETPDVGENLTYTLTVRNSGPGNSTDVTVSDRLPVGFLLASHSASQGDCRVSEGELICELGTLAADASATVVLKGRIQTDGILTHVATVGRSEPEKYLTNNSVTTRTRIASFFSFRVNLLTTNNLQSNGNLASSGSDPNFVGGLAATSIDGIHAGKEFSMLYSTAEWRRAKVLRNSFRGLFSDLATGEAYQLGLGGYPINNRTPLVTELLPVIEEGGKPNVGEVIREFWNGSFSEPSMIPVDRAPDDSDRQYGLEQLAYVSADRSGGIRLKTLVEAPETGDYTFYVSGDNSELYLSSDEHPANRVRIARGGAWTDSRSWTSYPEQRSVPISLVAGRRYHIEVLQAYRNSGSVGVGWKTPGSGDAALITKIPDAALHRPSRDRLDEPVIPLSQPIILGSKSGIFAGHRRVVIHNGSRVYHIDLPTGFVTDLGPFRMPYEDIGGTGWYWGIAENDRDSINLLYPREVFNQILRTQMRSGLTTVHSTFGAWMVGGPISAFPQLGFWTFMAPIRNEYGYSAPAIMLADASFSVTPATQNGNDVAISARGLSRFGYVADEVTTVITVTNSGPDPATAVQVIDRVSDGVEIRTATPSQGTVTTENGRVIATLGAIPAGGSATLTVGVAGLEADIALHSIEVTRGEADLYLPNNVATYAIPIILPEMRIGDLRVVEGNAGENSEAEFEVTLSNPITVAVQVNYETADGGAKAGVDYAATSGVLTIEPGQTRGTIRVPVIGDGVYEWNETFLVKLSGAIRAKIMDGEATATIENDEALPVVTVAPASVEEGNLGNRSLEFLLGLSGPSSFEIRVIYATADGTAVARRDYAPIYGVATFLPGETQKVVRVKVFGDTEVEPNEIVNLDLSWASGFADLPVRRVAGTITDDDGVAGRLHHFVFAPIASPQFLGEPFTVSVTAVDHLGEAVRDYAGPIPISARVPNVQNLNFLGNANSNLEYRGDYTVGFSLMPTVDITVTHFRTFFGVKATLWDESGDVLLSQPLPEGGAGIWSETRLTTPIILKAGRRYHYGVYTGNEAYYYSSGSSGPSSHAIRSFPTAQVGDTMIGSDFTNLIYLVDLRYELGGIVPASLSVSALSGFENGVWTGSISVADIAPNTVLTVEDGDGHRGESGVVQFGIRNDLSLMLSSSRRRPELGDRVTWTSTVRCLGPDPSSGVVVRQTLPEGVVFVSASASRGSGCAADEGDVRCDLGDLAAEETATVEMMGEVHAIGKLTLTATTARVEPENYLRNNSAQLVLTVPGGDEFRIRSLGVSGAYSINHAVVTGDTRGGIAVSDSRLFHTGDRSTGVYNLEDLSGGRAVGQQYDGLCSDLRSTAVYQFANAGNMVGFGGWTDSLIQLDGDTGAPTGTTIRLSRGIDLKFGSGIFSGYGHLLIWVAETLKLGRVYDIQLPSGAVTDLGPLTISTHIFGESWAFWGVAENFNGVLHLVHPGAGNSIVRTRVPDGMTEEVARFSSLGASWMFTVKPDADRWYWSHDGLSQFGVSGDAIGFADATFETRYRVLRNDVSVQVTPGSGAVNSGEVARFTLAVRNSGPSAASNVRLIAQLTGPATVTTATASVGTVSVDGNTLTVDVGALAPDVSVSIELAGQTAVGATGVVECAATVSRSEVDFLYNNNRGKASVALTTPALRSAEGGSNSQHPRTEVIGQRSNLPDAVSSAVGVGGETRPSLTIACIEKPTGSMPVGLLLSFDSAVDSRYVLEVAKTVAGPWASLKRMIGTGTRMEVMETTEGSEARMYRLRKE